MSSVSIGGGWWSGWGTARPKRSTRRSGPPSLCFGSRKLFHAQFHLAENGYASHAEGLQAWREARANAFFCLGSKDEAGGNQTCTLLPDGGLRLRVPHALAQQYGTHVAISGIRFRYGQEVIEAALAAGRAISYRFVRKDGAWYLYATTERSAAERVTCRQAGALGIDLNPDRVAVAELDRFGNPVAVRDIPVQVHGRRKEQVLATLGDAVADIVTWARESGKPVVVERLDFRAKKARLREVSDWHARKLSHFAYAAFHALLVSRAARGGVEVIEVNPAYTSVIGKVKFMARYGLSPHGAAAVAIARPGTPQRAWAEADARLVPASLRGKPRQGDTLSAPAPAGTGPRGPGRDGLAWAPGCDPPARIVGNTVRPAS